LLQQCGFLRFLQSILIVATIAQLSTIATMNRSFLVVCNKAFSYDCCNNVNHIGLLQKCRLFTIVATMWIFLIVVTMRIISDYCNNMRIIYQCCNNNVDCIFTSVVKIQIISDCCNNQHFNIFKLLGSAFLVKQCCMQPQNAKATHMSVAPSFSGRKPSRCCVGQSFSFKR